MRVSFLEGCRASARRATVLSCGRSNRPSPPGVGRLKQPLSPLPGSPFGSFRFSPQPHPPTFLPIFSNNFADSKKSYTFALAFGQEAAKGQPTRRRPPRPQRTGHPAVQSWPPRQRRQQPPESKNIVKSFGNSKICRNFANATGKTGRGPHLRRQRPRKRGGQSLAH